MAIMMIPRICVLTVVLTLRFYELAKAETEIQLLEQDPITPIQIEHRCEELFEGDRLIQIYNYIYYEFETTEHFYWARSYLEENNEVSIFGPFSKDDKRIAVEAPIDSGVISYFRRRYPILNRLGAKEYEAIP